MEILKLSQLNLYIRRVIALNFNEPVWITAELLSVKTKGGHVYLDLSEKDEHDQINAQNTAVIWKNTYDSIYKSIGTDLNNLLKEGNAIKILVTVDYHPRYGLKLNVQNIDAAYTFGKIAEARLKTIDKLKNLGLWQKNKLCQLPYAIKNIAIVSSKGSAGKEDFINQLSNNVYNYGFNLRLYNVSVQGQRAISEICNALHAIDTECYDVIVLIRGGGSKLDLAEFDAFEIAAQISTLEIPVFTGIGHFIDESIADLSAFLALKTPTAVADFIIQHNHNIELTLLEAFQNIVQYIKSNISVYGHQLAINQNTFREKIYQIHHLHKLQLTNLQFTLNHKIQQLYHSRTNALNEMIYYISSNDPESILKKGYCLAYNSNHIIKGIENIKTDEELKLKFYNGELTSKIIDIWKTNH